MGRGNQADAENRRIYMISSIESQDSSRIKNMITDAKLLAETEKLQSQVDGSFVQDKLHNDINSVKYQAIAPSDVAKKLIETGRWTMVYLATGQARKETYQHHQKTLCRLRSTTELSPGLFLDLVIRAAHLGRGNFEIFLGIFRVVCKNGMVTGSIFDSVKIRHSGDTMIKIDQSIQHLELQADRVNAMIAKLQSIQLDESQITDLAKKFAQIRLGVKSLDSFTSTGSRSLARVRRPEDQSNDAWTVFNRLQENSLKYGVNYGIASIDANGVSRYRRRTTRAVDERSSQSVDLNNQMFEEIVKLAA